MTIFQCNRCGCAEDVAFGFIAKSPQGPRAFVNYTSGTHVCSVCAPTCRVNGELTHMHDGTWHGMFPRIFLPHGMFITNGQGMVEHIETGISGNEAYKLYGKSEEYPNY